MKTNRFNIYLAAPLFTPGERAWNKHLRERLGLEADVYLPQEDGALLVDLVQGGMPAKEAKSVVFQNDVRAIERCQILVLVMDGRTIDEGACFELGYAFALGKVCVGLKTDVRTLLPIGDNPMIEGALRCVFRVEDDLVTWVHESAWMPT